MKLSRDFTNFFNWILDNLVPPIIRDTKFIMYPLFWLLFGKKAKVFMSFKENVNTYDDSQINETYQILSDVHIDRETDLNSKTVDFILENLNGESVLDIASGTGYLAKKIAENKKYQVTGVDFIISDDLLQSENTNPKFLVGNVENIPFPDNSFDTVISTHTLEHVFDIQKALDELRRVCKGKLIVVVPKQREYKYTFDLHIHFFPYKFSVLNLMKNKNGTCIEVHNDWVYTETVS